MSSGDGLERIDRPIKPPYFEIHLASCGVSMSKPYRFLNDPKAVMLLNAAFQSLDRRVRDCVDPETAYEPAIIEMESATNPDSDKIIIIQCDRKWWPDGENYEDATISLRMNDNVLGEIDVTSLMRTRLSMLLSEWIVNELVSAAGAAK
jgi:hypothetical protein